MNASHVKRIQGKYIDPDHLPMHGLTSTAESSGDTAEPAWVQIYYGNYTINVLRPP